MKKKKSIKLCKMGIHLYSSIFRNLYHLFFDSAGRYCTIQFYEYYRSGIKEIGPNFIGMANYLSLLKSDMFKYGANTLILWLIGFVPQILVALVLACWFTDARLR